MSFNFAALTNLFGNKFNTSTLLSTFGSYMLNGGSSGSASIFGYSNSNQNYGMQTNKFGYYTNYNQYGQARADQGFQNFLSIVSMFMPGIGSFFSNLVSGIVNDKLTEKLGQLGSENRSAVNDAKEKEARNYEQAGLENDTAKNKNAINLLANENCNSILQGTQYDNVKAKNISDLRQGMFSEQDTSIDFSAFNDIKDYLYSDLPDTDELNFTPNRSITKFSDIKEELDKVSQHESCLNELSTNIASLEIDKSKVKFNDKTAEKIDTQYNEAEEAVNTLNTKLTTTTEEATKAEKACDENEATITKNEAQIKSYDANIKLKETEIAQLKIRISMLNDPDSAAQKAKFETQLAEAEKEKAELQSKRDKLDADNQKCIGQQEQLNTTKNAKNTAKEETKTELDKKQGELKNLKEAQAKANEMVEQYTQTLNTAKDTCQGQILKQIEALKLYQEQLNELVMTLPEDSQGESGSGEITFSQLLKNQESETDGAKNLLKEYGVIDENGNIKEGVNLGELMEALEDKNEYNADRLKLINFMNEGPGDNPNISKKQAKQLMKDAENIYTSDGTFEDLQNKANKMNISLNATNEKNTNNDNVENSGTNTATNGKDTNNNDIIDNCQNTATNGVDKETFINQMRSEYGDVSKWVNDNVPGKTVTNDDYQKMQQEAGEEVTSFQKRVVDANPQFGDLENLDTIMHYGAAKDNFKNHVSMSEYPAIMIALKNSLELKKQGENNININ